MHSAAGARRWGRHKPRPLSQATTIPCASPPAPPHALPRACSLDPRWAPLSLRYPGTLSHLCVSLSTRSRPLPQRQRRAWGRLQRQVQVLCLRLQLAWLSRSLSGTAALLVRQTACVDRRSLRRAEFGRWVTCGQSAQNSKGRVPVSGGRGGEFSPFRPPSYACVGTQSSAHACLPSPAHWLWARKLWVVPRRLRSVGRLWGQPAVLSWQASSPLGARARTPWRVRRGQGKAASPRDPGS